MCQTGAPLYIFNHFPHFPNNILIFLIIKSLNKITCNYWSHDRLPHALKWFQILSRYFNKFFGISGNMIRLNGTSRFLFILIILILVVFSHWKQIIYKISNKTSISFILSTFIYYDYMRRYHSNVAKHYNKSKILCYIY